MSRADSRTARKAASGVPDVDTRAATYCGWNGRRFVFETPSGYRTVLSGPRAAVEAQLAKLLPAWKEVADKQGDTEFAALIQRAIEGLPQAVSP